MPYAKIENGVVIYPPKNDGNHFNVHRDEYWLATHGYRFYTPEELAELLPAPPAPPERYSTLKIIRALGEDWETYRAALAEAGVLDQFFAANYLASDDPVFQAFVATVPEEIVSRLDECQWEE